jgi:hypothetical protein
MKDKHEQLYVAVQDLLIELSITPKRLKDIAADKTHSSINPKIAQKLIDADLIVEQINWRQPGNVFGPHQKTDETNLSDSDQELPKPGSLDLLTFNAIKSKLSPQTLWLYLQEAHPEFLLSKQRNELSTFDKIKSGLAPGILWSYLQEKHPDFLYEQIKDYLFPGC